MPICIALCYTGSSDLGKYKVILLQCKQSNNFIIVSVLKNNSGHYFLMQNHFLIP